MFRMKIKESVRFGVESLGENLLEYEYVLAIGKYYGQILAVIFCEYSSFCGCNIEKW